MNNILNHNGKLINVDHTKLIDYNKTKLIFSDIIMINNNKYIYTYYNNIDEHLILITPKLKLHSLQKKKFYELIVEINDVAFLHYLTIIENDVINGTLDIINDQFNENTDINFVSIVSSIDNTRCIKFKFNDDKIFDSHIVNPKDTNNIYISVIFKLYGIWINEFNNSYGITLQPIKINFLTL